ncbi:hypothetical protein [Saccharopolyspora soli]|uniref:hypothetical protein n=1 Tax=Saccharopolyspora soli TaxID=2926618 RepID=UPI00241364DD|nr:hypothetical protein [Saccharopolyspora soli]
MALMVVMATLCGPSVTVPEYVVTLDFARRSHAGRSQLPLALRLIRNTGLAKRHIVRPIEETLRHITETALTGQIATLR